MIMGKLLLEYIVVFASQAICGAFLCALLHFVDFITTKPFAYMMCLICRKERWRLKMSQYQVVYCGQIRNELII